MLGTKWPPMQRFLGRRFVQAFRFSSCLDCRRRFRLSRRPWWGDSSVIAAGRRRTLFGTSRHLTTVGPRSGSKAGLVPTGRRRRRGRISIIVRKVGGLRRHHKLGGRRWWSISFTELVTIVVSIVGTMLQQQRLRTHSKTRITIGSRRGSGIFLIG